LVISANGGRGKLTVLVAEDFIDVRVLMRVLLESRGCRVVEAANGAQAIWKAVEEQPDLILMDLSMPVLDGIQAAAEIRKRPETSRIPVVAVTAHCGAEWREKALAAGCVECVEKPISLQIVGRLLSRYGRGGVARKDGAAAESGVRRGCSTDEDSPTILAAATIYH
jgi:CheY-like chemotaxis protein